MEDSESSKRKRRLKYTDQPNVEPHLFLFGALCTTGKLLENLSVSYLESFNDRVLALLFSLCVLGIFSMVFFFLLEGGRCEGEDWLYKNSMSWCSKFFRGSNPISAGYQSLYTTNEKNIIDIGLQKHCGEKILCPGMGEMRGETLGRNVFRPGLLHLDLYRGNISLCPNALFGPKTEQRPNVF